MSLTFKNLGRLHANILDAGVAIDSVNTDGIVSPTELQAAAQSIVDSFDTSDAAQSNWVSNLFSQKEPVLTGFSTLATAAMATNDAFLALATPTNAQVLAQVKALTQENTKIIQALGRAIDLFRP